MNKAEQKIINSSNLRYAASEIAEIHPEKAIVFLENALEDIKNLRDRAARKLRIDIYRWLSFCFIKTHDIESALHYSQKSLGIAERLRDINELSESQFTYSVVLNAAGKKEQSLRFLYAAAAGFKKLGDKKRLSETLSTSGNIELMRSNWDRSNKDLEESLKLAYELGDLRLQANIYTNFGASCTIQGDYEESINCHQLALSLYEQLKDHIGIGYAQQHRNEPPRTTADR